MVMVTSDVLEEIMRRIFASSLLLSASLLPAAAIAATPEAPGNAAQNVRISTGVVAPHLISAVNVVPPTTALAKSVPTPAQVGLDVVVDAQGQAQEVHVRQSLTPEWDASVVTAVKQFHFRPATLDGQPFAAKLHLLVDLR
jgi:hypothetical protein